MSAAAPLAVTFGGLTASFLAPGAVAVASEGAIYTKSNLITSYSGSGLAADFTAQSLFNLAEVKNIASNYNFISGGVSAFTGPFTSAFVGTKFSFTSDDLFTTKSTSTAIATGLVGGGLGKLTGNFSDYLGNNYRISGIDNYAQSFELTNPIAKMIGIGTEAAGDIPSKMTEKILDDEK